VLLLIPLLLSFWGSDFDNVLRAGLDALGRGDLPAAAIQLEAASKLQPTNGSAWLALAQTYRKQKRVADSRAAALKAEKFAGSRAIILRGLALFYSEGGEFTKSAKMLERYCDHFPKDSETALNTSGLYARGSDSASAIRMARRALAIKDSPETRLLLARLYAGSNRISECMTEWRRAAQQQPYDVETYFPVAQDLLAQQKFSDALTVIEAGLKILDKSAELELARGVALYGLKRFPEAIDSFLRTIQLDPRVEQPYLFLGPMVDVAGARQPAIVATFRTYSEKRPEDAMALSEYARALAAAGGDAQEVERLFKKAIQLKPDQWEFHFELGLAYERRQAYREAALEIEESIRLNRRAPLPHYRLARVYDKLGRKADAEAQRELHEKLVSGQK
jgi:tetratricopeptide (TPR) repeat protein